MEEIKLYEYDYDKMELSEETLSHHGILGMKWGIRKQKPSSGKGHISKRKAKKLRKRRVKSLKKARKARELKRQQELQSQKTKEDIIKTKDIASMLKNVDKFSNDEINNMLTRLDTEAKLAERVRKQAEANAPISKKLGRKAKKAVGEGISRGTDSLIKTVSENALKMGVKYLAAEAALGDEQYEQIVNQLFKEKKK